MRDGENKYSHSLRSTAADDKKPYKPHMLKTIVHVLGKQMDEGFILKTTEAEVVGLRGDYLVKTLDGFVFVLPEPVFKQLFEPI